MRADCLGHDVADYYDFILSVSVRGPVLLRQEKIQKIVQRQYENVVPLNVC
jgi:hypothetical protein